MVLGIVGLTAALAPMFQGGGLTANATYVRLLGYGAAEPGVGLSALAVDDAAQGITDVVRGADLLDSTARQIYLQRLLGLATPRYLHVPVATNAAGEKLSKQTRAADAAEGDLARALEFLGMNAAHGYSPRELLGWAIQNWDVARIPRKRALIAGPY